MMADNAAWWFMCPGVALQGQTQFIMGPLHAALTDFVSPADVFYVRAVKSQGGTCWLAPGFRAAFVSPRWENAAAVVLEVFQMAWIKMVSAVIWVGLINGRGRAGWAVNTIYNIRFIERLMCFRHILLVSYCQFTLELNFYSRFLFCGHVNNNDWSLWFWFTAQVTWGQWMPFSVLV